MNNFNINSQKPTKKTASFRFLPSHSHLMGQWAPSGHVCTVTGYCFPGSRVALSDLVPMALWKDALGHKGEKEGATWLPYCCDSHRKVSVLFSHPTPSELQLSCSAKRRAEVEDGWDYPGCIARETRLCWTGTELPPCCSCRYLSI